MNGKRCYGIYELIPQRGGGNKLRKLTEVWALDWADAQFEAQQMGYVGFEIHEI